MREIILLIFSVLYITFSFGQVVGGWGNCEFATVATMNAFDPSTNAYDCKKVFVQATDEHYHWDGTQWVLDSEDVENIYNTDGTLDANRIVSLGGNDLTLDGSSDVVFKSDGKVGLGIDSPLSPFHIKADGTGSNGIIKVEGTEPDIVFDDTNGGFTTFTFRNAGTNQVAFGKSNTNDFYITRYESGWHDNSFVLKRSTGNIGIGTAAPGARLDVEGGTVKFSDYGTGANTGTETYMLGVDTDGDVIEMNTAKSAKIFYPPAIAVTADAIAIDLTIDLHQQYVTLFGSPAVTSTSAPAAIPTYGETELYYYITDYDTDIFENVTIGDNGIMEYDVKEVPSDNCSFINIVFVVK